MCLCVCFLYPYSLLLCIIVNYLLHYVKHLEDTYGFAPNRQHFDWSVVVFPAVCVARQQIGRKDCVS